MRPPGFSALFETIRVKSLRRGLLGGSRIWLTVFVARIVWRGLVRVSKQGDMEVKYSERLAPGETLVIRHVDPD